MIYPWQQQQWQQFLQRHENQHLPHALILHGTRGLGKFEFAINVAETVIENRPELIRQQSHPDCVVLQPEKAGGAIKVDQVRQLTNQLNQTAQFNGYKVAIIDPADQMNTQAANALLKTLEEPPGDVLLLLVCHQLGTLPATILSRCQRMDFNSADQSSILSWLQGQLPDQPHDLLLRLADYSPLLAVEFAKQDQLTLREQALMTFIQYLNGKASLVKASEQLNKLDFNWLLYFLILFIKDCLLIQSGAVEFVANQDKMPTLGKVAEGFDDLTFLAALERLNKMQQGLKKNYNLNTLLLIENWLLIFRKGDTC